MRKKTSSKLASIAETVEFIVSQSEGHLRLATPIGIGKPNPVLNQIYDRVKKDPSLTLRLFTGLSLSVPTPKGELEELFLRPFLQRHFGADYPELQYVKDLQQGQLPENVIIHEFYSQAGAYLNADSAQKNYVSCNYTHAARAIMERETNVIIQFIAKAPDGLTYSLSCNPDLTLDLSDAYESMKKPLCVIGVVHPDLPFLGGDAVVTPDFFDAILETSEITHSLFAIPKGAISRADHMIGIHASRLIKDGGTLQIGIGSLSDALINATLIRHRHNDVYRKIVDGLDDSGISEIGGTDIFQKGLYGMSELIMDGFMHLRNGGVLKREVTEFEEAKKRYLHGAFFVGSKDFYHWLKTLSKENFEGLAMSRISKVNDLYDDQEATLRRQRKQARFFNTCMKVNLARDAASDTLENGRLVSGVGGQYNFVAMAQELADAHSILMLRSTRTVGNRRVSNIVENHGHLTIPRHLRDIVITEYGIARLFSKTDEEVVTAIINITDAEFQDDLIMKAQTMGKLSRRFKPHPSAKNNTPEKIKQLLAPYQDAYFRSFPFGSDFTPTELILAKALSHLKEDSKKYSQLFKVFLKGLGQNPEKYQRELQRMNLANPETIKSRFYQKLILGALKQTYIP